MPYECSAAGDASGFRGCDRSFGALIDYDRHFTRVTLPDDPSRDPAVVSVTGERCMTDAELGDRGFEPNERGVWRDMGRVRSTGQWATARTGGWRAVRLAAGQ